MFIVTHHKAVIRLLMPEGLVERHRCTNVYIKQIRVSQPTHCFTVELLKGKKRGEVDLRTQNPRNPASVVCAH